MLTDRPSCDHTSLAQSDHSGPVTLFCAFGNTVSPPCSGVVLLHTGSSVILATTMQERASHQQHAESSEQLAKGAQAFRKRTGRNTHRYMRTVAIRWPPFSGRALTLSWK